MARTLRFNICDVFTDVALAGNQLAVFTDARGLPEDRMLELAREIGFAETVFVLPPEADGHARIRIFTPTRELRFAGHPTLGAAFVLGGPLQATLLKLETGAGLVPVVLQREGARIIFGTMAQPLPTCEPYDRVEELLAVLGVEQAELPVEIYDNGSRHVFVALPDAETVAALRPSAEALTGVGDHGVSCFAVDGRRVKTRMFWPDAGVLEDAATGSAAGPLAIHLARHGLLPWGEEIHISQGAEIGRPSLLVARPHGDESGATDVEVGGSAVVVARGEFVL